MTYLLNHSATRGLGDGLLKMELLEVTTLQQRWSQSISPAPASEETETVSTIEDIKFILFGAAVNHCCVARTWIRRNLGCSTIVP